VGASQVLMTGFDPEPPVTTVGFAATQFAIAATVFTERDSPKYASDRLPRASPSIVYPSDCRSCQELL
jgi:hypothetical protein